MNVEKYLNIFKDYPYIFNLGHGVLPETKPEIIEYVINIIRNKKLRVREALMGKTINGYRFQYKGLHCIIM